VQYELHYYLGRTDAVQYGQCPLPLELVKLCLATRYLTTRGHVGPCMVTSYNTRSKVWNVTVNGWKYQTRPVPVKQVKRDSSRSKRVKCDCSRSEISNLRIPGQKGQTWPFSLKKCRMRPFTFKNAKRGHWRSIVSSLAWQSMVQYERSNSTIWPFMVDLTHFDHSWSIWPFAVDSNIHVQVDLLDLHGRFAHVIWIVSVQFDWQSIWKLFVRMNGRTRPMY
jgi:hypothetical protein